MSEDSTPTLTEEIVQDALRKVKDPEAGINIVDLGLIYDVAIDQAKVDVKMTLTSPGCPAGPQIMGDTDEAVRALDGVGELRRWQREVVGDAAILAAVAGTAPQKPK
jgi:metal-sulfur cluster biosynthetic enzyme